MVPTTKLNLLLFTTLALSATAHPHALHSAPASFKWNKKVSRDNFAAAACCAAGPKCDRSLAEKSFSCRPRRWMSQQPLWCRQVACAFCKKSSRREHTGVCQTESLLKNCRLRRHDRGGGGKKKPGRKPSKRPGKWPGRKPGKHAKKQILDGHDDVFDEDYDHDGDYDHDKIVFGGDHHDDDDKLVEELDGSSIYGDLFDSDHEDGHEDVYGDAYHEDPGKKRRSHPKPKPGHRKPKRYQTQNQKPQKNPKYHGNPKQKRRNGKVQRHQKPNPKRWHGKPKQHQKQKLEPPHQPKRYKKQKPRPGNGNSKRHQKRNPKPPHKSTRHQAQKQKKGYRKPMNQEKQKPHRKPKSHRKPHSKPHQKHPKPHKKPHPKPQAEPVYAPPTKPEERNCVFQGVNGRLYIRGPAFPVRSPWQRRKHSIVWRPGGDEKIDAKGSGAACVQVKSDRSGPHYVTLVSSAPSRTEHNDAWLRVSSGVTLHRTETKSVRGGDTGFFKVYQNVGGNVRTRHVLTIDRDGHEIITKPLRRGRVYQVCLAGRSARFRVFGVALVACHGREKCSRSDEEVVTALRKPRPSQCVM